MLRELQAISMPLRLDSTHSPQQLQSPQPCVFATSSTQTSFKKPRKSNLLKANQSQKQLCLSLSLHTLLASLSSATNPLCRNTHVSFTNAQGDDVVGVVKSYNNGKYHIQTRSELKTEHTHEVEEAKVRELKLSRDNEDACPVVGGK